MQWSKNVIKVWSHAIYCLYSYYSRDFFVTLENITLYIVIFTKWLYNFILKNSSHINGCMVKQIIKLKLIKAISIDINK